MPTLSAKPASRRAAAPWPWRIASWSATLAGAALLGIVLAHWGWRWIGPAPAPLTPTEVERYAPLIVAAPVFGRAEPASTPAAASTSGSAPAGDPRLLGVLAERGGGGWALFQRGERGSAVLVRVGEPIAADVTLIEVRPDGVSIRDHGARRDVALRPPAPRPTSAPPPPSAAAAGKAAPAGARAACAGPPGYRGPVYRLNAELLTGVAARPDSWSGVVAPAQGGLAIRDDAGFATMLGMKGGDVMAQANGIALTRADDVIVAFVNPLLASQSVYVVGTRNGQPADWLFVNAGACPG